MRHSLSKACGIAFASIACALVLVALCAVGVAQAADLQAASLSTSSADSGVAAMYRVYNPNSGEHFYTANSYERDHLVGVGWRYEGVGWAAPVSSSTPVYRLYNPNAGDHHYTLDSHERDHLVGVGWRYEGVGWYSDDAQGVPLYRLYNPNAVAGAHHCTINAYERDNLDQVGWNAEGIGWYGVDAVAEEVPLGDEPIMGQSQTTVAQMVRRYNNVSKPYPSSVYSQYGAADIEQFCQIVYEEATAEGVRAEVVFAQAMHETGWLQFGGDVKPEQCNFAGIGAVGGGAHGASFGTVRAGIRAQVQHLKAYASTDPCVNTVVDPRFFLVKRGVAPTVQGLSGRWATGAGYGDALVNQIHALLAA